MKPSAPRNHRSIPPPPVSRLQTPPAVRYSRNRPQQPPGISMPRTGKQLPRRRPLHDSPGAHHRHHIRRGPHHPEIVGYQENRHTQFVPQAHDKTENPRLGACIQSRRRFIRNQKFRSSGYRRRDKHPLLHPPRELMGVGAQHLPGVHAHHLQQLRRPAARLRPVVRPVIRPMPANHLHQKRSRRERRIQMLPRLLEHHRRMPPANRGHAPAIPVPAPEVPSRYFHN